MIFLALQRLVHAKPVVHRVKKTEQVTHKAVAHQSLLSALSCTVSCTRPDTPHAPHAAGSDQYIHAVGFQLQFSDILCFQDRYSDTNITLLSWPAWTYLSNVAKNEKPQAHRQVTRQSRVAVCQLPCSGYLHWCCSMSARKDLWLWFASATDCVHSCSTSADGRSFLSHFHPACAACSILLADLTGPVQTQAVDGWKLVSIISHFAPVWRTGWQWEYTDVGLASTGCQRAQGSTHGVGRKHWWFSGWAGVEKKRAETEKLCRCFSVEWGQWGFIEAGKQ